MKTDNRRPYADTRMAKFLDKRIEQLVKTGLSQRELSRMIGLNTPNALSMMKNGEFKVSLERVPAMAKALDVDVIYLFRLAFEQMGDDMMTAAREIFNHVATENEREWLSVIREASGAADPKLTDDTRQALADIVSKNYAATAA